MRWSGVQHAGPGNVGGLPGGRLQRHDPGVRRLVQRPQCRRRKVLRGAHNGSGAATRLRWTSGSSPLVMATSARNCWRASSPWPRVSCGAPGRPTARSQPARPASAHVVKPSGVYVNPDGRVASDSSMLVAPASRKVRLVEGW